MKKTFYSFLFVIIWISMKTDPPIEYTILAYGTPYRNLPQVMKGKIKSVIEKYYWAVPDGQSYKRGTPLTRADRNSLLWSDDFEIQFSPDGKILSCNDFDDSGKLIVHRHFIYENSEFIKEIWIRPDNQTSEYFLYDLREWGKVVISCYRGKDDSLRYKTVIKLNDTRMPAENHFLYSKTDTSQKILFSYDPKNRLINSKYFNQSGETFERIAIYNDSTRTYRVEYHNKENEITRAFYHSYEYDERGNWIRAIVKDLNNRMIIQERTIIYY
jgi:hypothetical protein